MKKEIAKLNIIIGQIQGLSKMIETGDDCEKIIIQFQAVKGALEAVFNVVLNDNLDRCLRGKRSKELKTILKQITKR
ncbi:metal-sensing transcriptional repressor [bacterium]|nr:metal-sensing transcriptional repressor [bacterium]